MAAVSECVMAFSFCCAHLNRHRISERNSHKVPDIPEIDESPDKAARPVCLSEANL